jgi:hypothetical protein
MVSNYTLATMGDVGPDLVVVLHALPGIRRVESHALAGIIGPIDLASVNDPAFECIGEGRFFGELLDKAERSYAAGVSLRAEVLSERQVALDRGPEQQKGHLELEGGSHVAADRTITRVVIS